MGDHRGRHQTDAAGQRGDPGGNGDRVQPALYPVHPIGGGRVNYRIVRLQSEGVLDRDEVDQAAFGGLHEIGPVRGGEHAGGAGGGLAPGGWVPAAAVEGDGEMQWFGHGGTFGVVGRTGRQYWEWRAGSRPTRDGDGPDRRGEPGAAVSARTEGAVHALQVDVPAGDPAAPIPRCAGGSDCARPCTLHRVVFHRAAVHRHQHSPRALARAACHQLAGTAGTRQVVTRSTPPRTRVAGQQAGAVR